MNCQRYYRAFTALLLVGCFVFPAPVFAKKKGQKNYQRGLEFETNQQWEQAAQEFTLAIAANPSDTEYQLHYRRAIYNASQSFMQKARVMTEKHDYAGAYNAYQQAYNYDPTNELAKAMMERTSRLQQGLETDGETKTVTPQSTAQLTGPVSANVAASGNFIKTSIQEPLSQLSRAGGKRRVISFAAGVELKSVIRTLAQDLGLNVIFDSQSFNRSRTTELELRDVTTAQALDYIFIQEGLFFQRLDRRTIFIADQTKRAQFQQLAVRTYYLKNADPEQTKNLIQTLSAAQPGKPPTVAVPDKTTNSLTVRDTPENLRQIEKIIKNVDKDRAAVAIDVNIYEVSRGDLMQLGNQIGDGNTLGRLGQSGPLGIFGGNRQSALSGLTIPTAFGAAFSLPSSTLTAFQSKDRTRVIASTTVNAFDGKKSTHNIGRRVPVQTAQVTPLGGYSPQTNGTNSANAVGANPGLFGGTGYPVIQYVETGLILEFTPQVFPNHDVQLEMKITSKETSGGVETLTPTFTERSIDGMARIANNRTMMIASIAQDRQSNGRKGMPVVGLVPVLGRLFTAPTRDNQQTDIVITVTPRVLRAPVITSEDEEIRPSGTMQSPTTESLAEMFEQDARQDQLAALQNSPRASTPPAPTSQPLPDAPNYLPAPKILMGGSGEKSINSSVELSSYHPSAPLGREANKTAVPRFASAISDAVATEAVLNKPHNEQLAELHLSAIPAQMRVGQKCRLALTVNTQSRLSLAVAALRYNPRVISVHAVHDEILFPANAKSHPKFTNSTDPQGSLLFSFTAPAGKPMTGSDALIFLDIEALSTGNTRFAFDPTAVHLITDDGKTIDPRLTEGTITIIP